MFVCVLVVAFIADGFVNANPMDPMFGRDSKHFEGDIAFPDGLDIWSYASSSNQDYDYSTGTKEQVQLWKSGIIPYVMSTNMNGKERTTIKNAINEFSKYTCIKWVQRDYEDDYVLIKKGPLHSGCWSNVGKIGSVNKINLDPRCFKKGIVLHEMMHTLGFFHEQSRPDRDRYVKVVLKNVKEQRHKDFFNKFTIPQMQELRTDYDCDSIMHYPKFAFAKRGTKTIIPKTAECQKIGQRIKLSWTDIEKIKSLYCVRKNPGSSSKPTGSKEKEEEIFEGDIIFRPGHSIWSYATPLDGNGIRGRDQESAIKSEYQIWQGGIIPYLMSATIKDRERLVIYEAMLQFSTHTCIKWVPRSHERDYVSIKTGKGCRSDVGRVGFVNKIVLGPRCFKKGIIMHEMMHTAGFFHEQSRADRDQYVTINWENIIKGKSKNFLQYTLQQIDHLGTEYDCNSIMHYAKDAFAIPDTETITPKSSKCKNLGQRVGFSATDIKELNLLYKCSPRVKPTVPMKLVKINCQVSSWGPWSSCSVTCGNRKCFMTRKRLVTQRRRHGGKSCPRLKQTSSRNLNPCPKIYKCSSLKRDCNSAFKFSDSFTGTDRNFGNFISGVRARPGREVYSATQVLSGSTETVKFEASRPFSGSISFDRFMATDGLFLKICHNEAHTDCPYLIGAYDIGIQYLSWKTETYSFRKKKKIILVAENDGRPIGYMGLYNIVIKHY